MTTEETNFVELGFSQPFGRPTADLVMQANIPPMLGDFNRYSSSHSPGPNLNDPEWLRDCLDLNFDAHVTRMSKLKTRKYILRKTKLQNEIDERMVENQNRSKMDPPMEPIPLYDVRGRSENRYVAVLPTKPNDFLSELTTAPGVPYLFGYCNMLTDQDFGAYQDPAGIILSSVLSQSLSFGIDFGKLFRNDSNLKLNSCAGSVYNFINKIVDINHRSVRDFALGPDMGDSFVNYDSYDCVGIKTFTSLYNTPIELRKLRVFLLSKFFGIYLKDEDSLAGYQEYPRPEMRHFISGFVSYSHLWLQASKMEANNDTTMTYRGCVVRAYKETLTVGVLSANLPNADGKTVHRRHIVFYGREAYWKARLLTNQGWPNMTDVGPMYKMSSLLGEEFFKAQIGCGNQTTKIRKLVFQRDAAAVRANWKALTHFTFSGQTLVDINAKEAALQKQMEENRNLKRTLEFERRDAAKKQKIIDDTRKHLTKAKRAKADLEKQLTVLKSNNSEVVTERRWVPYVSREADSERELPPSPPIIRRPIDREASTEEMDSDGGSPLHHMVPARVGRHWFSPLVSTLGNALRSVTPAFLQGQN